MRYVHFYCLGIALLLLSCAGREVDVPVFKYSLETSNVANYILNTQSTDSLLLFDYAGLKDSVAPYEINYVSDNHVLISKGRTFSSTGVKYDFENLVFTMYQEKTPNGNLVTLVFNEKYGLLASLGFGENFIFSKELMIPKIKEYNFKRIFRSINNIRIE